MLPRYLPMSAAGMLYQGEQWAVSWHLMAEVFVDGVFSQWCGLSQTCNIAKASFQLKRLNSWYDLVTLSSSALCSQEGQIPFLR